MAACSLDECSVCTNKFTSTRRKPIKCKNHECEEICCLECFETYLLTDGSTTPCCMFCNEPIQHSYIRDHCSLSFCNKKFMDKRLENETGNWKARLPDYQDDVLLIKAKREHEKIKKEYHERAEKYFEKGRKIMREFYSIPEPVISHIKGNKDNKISFIQRCPSGDCEGFLSASWKCGVCEEFYCSKCHARKNGKNDEEHVCNEDDVASVAAIKKDSRPCPKCGVPINKSSGCDQMWCPQPGCDTAFSYRTGKIDTGNRHNPHYYEFMRKQNGGNIPRNPGDIPPCEQVPRIYDIQRILETLRNKKGEKTPISIREKIRNFLFRFYRERHHVEGVYLPQLRVNFDREYRDMGVKFLMKEIEESEAKSSIRKIIKKKEKNIELNQIYRLFITVSGENLKNIYEAIRQSYPDTEIINEIEKLINLTDYCNKSLNSLSGKFKNTVKLIDEIKF